MTTSTQHETTIEAHPELPSVRIAREFDAPVANVWRAHVDPDLVVQWMGPRAVDMEIATWDLRTGGEYRYTARMDGKELAHIYGSFHRVDEPRRIVQTFGFDEQPDATALETLTLTALGDRRTGLEIVSLVPTMADRDAMLASGMEVGIIEGYERLDELLGGTP